MTLISRSPRQTEFADPIKDKGAGLGPGTYNPPPKKHLGQTARMGRKPKAAPPPFSVGSARLEPTKIGTVLAPSHPPLSPAASDPSPRRRPKSPPRNKGFGTTFGRFSDEVEPSSETTGPGSYKLDLNWGGTTSNKTFAANTLKNRSFNDRHQRNLRRRWSFERGTRSTQKVALGRFRPKEVDRNGEFVPDEFACMAAPPRQPSPPPRVPTSGPGRHAQPTQPQGGPLPAEFQMPSFESPKRDEKAPTPRFGDPGFGAEPTPPPKPERKADPLAPPPNLAPVRPSDARSPGVRMIRDGRKREGLDLVSEQLNTPGPGAYDGSRNKEINNSQYRSAGTATGGFAGASTNQAIFGQTKPSPRVAPYQPPPAAPRDPGPGPGTYAIDRVGQMGRKTEPVEFRTGERVAFGRSTGGGDQHPVPVHNPENPGPGAYERKNKETVHDVHNALKANKALLAGSLSVERVEILVATTEIRAPMPPTPQKKPSKHAKGFCSSSPRFGGPAKEIPGPGSYPVDQHRTMGDQSNSNPYAGRFTTQEASQSREAVERRREQEVADVPGPGHYTQKGMAEKSRSLARTGVPSAAFNDRQDRWRQLHGSAPNAPLPGAIESEVLPFEHLQIQDTASTAPNRGCVVGFDKGTSRGRASGLDPACAAARGDVDEPGPGEYGWSIQGIGQGKSLPRRKKEALAMGSNSIRFPVKIDENPGPAEYNPTPPKRLSYNVMAR